MINSSSDDDIFIQPTENLAGATATPKQDCDGLTSSKNDQQGIIISMEVRKSDFFSRNYDRSDAGVSGKYLRLPSSKSIFKALVLRSLY